MKILLSGFGNVAARFGAVLSYCENYIDRNTEGHEIITFGYNKGVDILIDPADDFGKVVEKLPVGWMPDLCILWGIEWNLLPLGIENASFPTVAVVFDLDYDLPLTKAIVESTDIAVTVGDYEKEALLAIGANNVEELYYQGLMEEYFHPSPTRVKDRKYDILYTTFIDDNAQPSRSKWIFKLSSLSDKYNVCIEGTIPNYDDYVDLLRKSKLVFSHHRYGSMSLRILEAGAQGAVVLETGTDVKKCFEPDKEYIPVTEDNILEQVERYLNNQELLQSMSDKVYKKVTEGYEARKRFVKLLDHVAEKLKNKNTERKTGSFSDSEKFILRGEVYYHSFFRNTKGPFVMKFNSFLELGLEEFKKAVAIEAGPRAMTNMAVAMTTYGFNYFRDSMIESKGEEVVSVLERVISLYPSYAMAHFNLGLLHLRVNNLREALNVFTNAIAVFRDKESNVDPWCLYPRDYDLFNLWKPLSDNLLLSCRGEKKAEDKIRNLYQAAMQYYIYQIEEEEGDIYKALEALKESHNSYPESGLVKKELASLLNILGFKEEGLLMYKKAIELLPFNVDLRIDYVALLHLYKMSEEAFDEIREILHVIRAVKAFRGKTHKLKDLAESFGLFNSGSGYSHDSCREEVLNGWAEQLYICLRKHPHNINLVLRIIQVYDELGRVDKIFEILEDYINKRAGDGNITDDEILAINDIYDYLQKVCYESGRFYSEKLNKLKFLISNSQKTPSVY